MKRIWLPGLVIIIIVAITIGISYKQSNLNLAVPSKTTVIVSLPLLKDIVREIGGDEVIVQSIIEGPSCNHHYEPTTGNLKQVAKSSLFVKVGLDFDQWVDKLIKNAGSPNLMVIDAAAGINLINENEEAEQEHEPHHEEEESKHNHGSVNPHYWGNPANIKIVAQNILNGLIKIKPEQKEVFTANYNQYITKVDNTIAELQAKVNSLPNKTIVSYSAAFHYFYEFFGFNCLATVEDTCEQEISARRLTEVAKIIKQHQVKIVVGEAVYPNLPRNLTAATGTDLVLLWPATDESGNYLETLKVNVEKLVTALK
ncbi:MAG TPA: metal ABC transporter substrate-binding protein [Bacillota bacterium]|jgi:zinc transport system substrate-binding protein|nr:metal ABC transporter substrate-binding protein [Bacillota bacterium]HOL10772.1 metal ABC transporter substrate-binding protein [Bacillota bacterium]HPO98483.1 metal ABC transporter substrate-binding protein [Bacillota bacterium]